MKKILLTILLAVSLTQSQGVVRVKNLNPAANTLTIQNFANFVYNYSQFQLSIGNSYYTLSNLSYTGGLNMLAQAYVYFYALTLPPEMLAGQEMLSGTSIAIWYPNSLPNNATPANLVDFLQYGSAGNPYESVAVAAGKWTAGDFISVAPPYQFNGTINDYGSSFFSTATSVSEINAVETGLQILPNPVNNLARIIVPNDFNKNQLPIELTLFNINGEAVMSSMKDGAKEYLIDCNDFADGVYTVQLKDLDQNTITTRLIKSDK